MSPQGAGSPQLPAGHCNHYQFLVAPWWHSAGVAATHEAQNP